MKTYPIPTKKQKEWSDLELGVIIHHCMETYHPEIPMSEWKRAADKMPAQSFAPTNEDTDQWLSAAAEMGAKYAVLVTNHVTGFSLWPTKENEYSIAASPYMAGKADIVKAFIDSCKKYDIKPGLYYSTGCNGYYGINDDCGQVYESEAYQEYVSIVERQLKEIWGNYGELFEIWFDGGVIPYQMGGPNVVELIKAYQPDAVCFQGPKEHHQNLRWVGNERGVAPIDCWSTSNNNTCGFGGTEEDDAIGVGNPEGKYWIPAETDMPNRSHEAFAGGWGWAADQDHLVLSPEALLECYYTSVGRNSNLLIGMAINQEGLFDDVEQFRRFGELVRGIYEAPLATTKGTGNVFEITLEKESDVENLVIMEDIAYGERVRAFSVFLQTDDGEEAWFQAKCIGHKRIVRINKKIKGIKVVIDECIDVPVLQAITLYQ